MTTKLKQLLFFLLLSTSICAQNEGNVWCFGNQKGLNFNAGSNLIADNNAMQTFEGCASICDAEGNLLFYSNGGGRAPGQFEQNTGMIWNTNHGVMYDMMGMEGGGFSSHQSSVIVPKPNTPNHYYLFTMDESEGNTDGTPKRGFSYFEIDMDENGGLGGVVDYVESLVLNTEEVLAACRHANGVDYWVVIYNLGTDMLDFFSVTSAGVNFSSSAAMPSNVGAPQYVIFSPDGQKMYVRNSNLLFDFDDNTGQISNPISIEPVDPSLIFGCSFSQNSKYLYMINISALIRFDMTASDVLGSMDIVEELDNPTDALVFWEMQMAPNGNIYILEPFILNPDVELSVLNCANSEGAYLERSIHSYPGEVFIGLPNFTNHIFANENDLSVTIDADATEIGPGQTLNLSVNTNPQYTIEWSTGETGPSIDITTAGTYSVTITDGTCGEGMASIEITDITSGVEEEMAGFSLEVFPVPFQNEINIEYANQDDPIEEVQLHASNGQLILAVKENNIRKIAVPNLPTGLYFMEITTGNGNVLLKKVVRE